MKLSARAVQVQQQRMSQQQIMSLNMLAMPSLDLRDEIYSKAKLNPALEIVSDSLEQGAKVAREGRSRFSDNTRYGFASAAGELASDNFQAALESREDDRETLQEHLERQFNAMRHSPEEEELGLRLIRNLDANGFHLLAPISLLDKQNPVHTPEFLQTCMEKIRALDPIGTCCSGVEESLLVQARIRGDADDVSLFILDGHLDFLNPPQGAKVLKKIDAFFKDRASLSFVEDSDMAIQKWAQDNPLTESDVEDAIAYIRTLDPYPARNFSSVSAHYIAPDVYVERIPLSEEDEKNGIVEEGGYSFKLTLARDSIPKIGISKNYAALAESAEKPVSEQQKAERRFVQDAIKDAKVFIESVQFRETTIARACAEIVRRQARFFADGARYLVPLRQKDIAEAIGVHEATVSRMANGKYVQCDQGLYEISYFFTNAVGGKVSSGSAPSGDGSAKASGSQGSEKSGGQDVPTSKEAVKFEIAQILEAHRNDKKPLSDQKISDMLAEKGISVARRTVAKYRGELHINSSYER